MCILFPTSILSTSLTNTSHSAAVNTSKIPIVCFLDIRDQAFSAISTKKKKMVTDERREVYKRCEWSANRLACIGRREEEKMEKIQSLPIPILKAINLSIGSSIELSVTRCFKHLLICCRRWWCSILNFNLGAGISFIEKVQTIREWM